MRVTERLGQLPKVSWLAGLANNPSSPSWRIVLSRSALARSIAWPASRICWLGDERPRKPAVAECARTAHGVCQRCGAPTQARNGKTDAHAFCKKCHPGAVALKWTCKHIREAMRARQQRCDNPPTSYHWSPTHAGRRGHEALLRPQDDEWPPRSTANELYAGWTASRADAFPDVGQARGIDRCRAHRD